MSEATKEIGKYAVSGNNSHCIFKVEMIGSKVDEDVYPDGFGPNLKIETFSWTGGINPSMVLCMDGFGSQELIDLGAMLIAAGKTIENVQTA